MDVWGWAGIALFLGPVLAALAIPLLKWLFDDPRRLILLVLVLGAVYWKVSHRKPTPAGTPAAHVQ